MRPVRLLITDVDGTLVTQRKVLTARSRHAVERLRDAGIALAVTSGRPPRGMAMLVTPLELTTPIATFNGGMIVAPELTTVLEQRTIPVDVAGDVVDYLLASGLDVWVYRGTDWFIRDASAPHVAREQATVRFEPTVERDLRSVLDGAVKITAVSDDGELMARCRSELLRRVGTRAAASLSQPYYLDVTHPDANKGMVVRVFSRLLDIPIDQIATIGDGANDVLMFAIAGTSIAMGNASPDVQRAAQHITTSNEDEGFAMAVESFILGKP